jgi:hypothetical protein
MSKTKWNPHQRGYIPPPRPTNVKLPTPAEQLHEICKRIAGIPASDIDSNFFNSCAAILTVRVKSFNESRNNDTLPF